MEAEFSTIDHLSSAGGSLYQDDSNACDDEEDYLVYVLNFDEISPIITFLDLERLTYLSNESSFEERLHVYTLYIYFQN